jgi:hypothetical protein
MPAASWRAHRWAVAILAGIGMALIPHWVGAKTPLPWRTLTPQELQALGGAQLGASKTITVQFNDDAFVYRLNLRTLVMETLYVKAGASWSSQLAVRDGGRLVKADRDQEPEGLLVQEQGGALRVCSAVVAGPCLAAKID